jgi:hypothetical protein
VVGWLVGGGEGRGEGEVGEAVEDCEGGFGELHDGGVWGRRVSIS